jgi:hypothetical protein
MQWQLQLNPNLIGVLGALVVINQLQYAVAVAVKP